ncbi:MULTISPECIES: hypothetical protein [unclassified Ruegeria]|uniref:hypothetical protein n=1 Tax=unclassified Ruegeria TaxID=2625375 RepID=UPI001AE4AFED|nr:MULTISPECIES: hypothetical protein [unclassified Ruegeria]
MNTSTVDLIGILRPDELEAHRANLAQKASLLASMPSPKEIEENWPIFLEWQFSCGAEVSPSSLSQVFEDQPEVHLGEFFQFWHLFQDIYLAVLTYRGAMTMEGVVDSRQ